MKEQLIKDITKTREFGQQVGTLTRQLHIKDEDAGQHLLVELVEHRFAKLSDLEVYEMMQTNKHYYRKILKFARQDAARRLYKPDNQQKDLVDKVEVIYDEVVEPFAYDNQDDSDNRLLERLDQIGFKNKTKQFIVDVIEHGQGYVMDEWGLSRKQFNNKINYIVNIAREAPDSTKISRLQGELRVVEDAIKLLERESFTDNDMTGYVRFFNNYFEGFIVGIEKPNIKNPVMLLECWKDGYLKDKYRFVNELYSRRDMIKDKLG